MLATAPYLSIYPSIYLPNLSMYLCTCIYIYISMYTKPFTVVFRPLYEGKALSARRLMHPRWASRFGIETRCWFDDGHAGVRILEPLSYSGPLRTYYLDTWGARVRCPFLGVPMTRISVGAPCHQHCTLSSCNYTARASEITNMIVPYS